MSQVFINQKMDFSREVIYEMSNGQTRRVLRVVNKLGDIGKTDRANCNLGYLNKGNHSFIFLNPERKSDDRVLGLFLNSAYGYDVLSGDTLFENSSVGGYGNSESKFGIYTEGTIIETCTYKHRTEGNVFELTNNGWVERSQTWLAMREEQVEV